MMSTAVTKLGNTLKSLGAPKKKARWERYLKEKIEFFGVSMAKIRTAVAASVESISH